MAKIQSPRTAPEMNEPKSIVVIPPKQAVIYRLKQTKNWYCRIKYDDKPGYYKCSTKESDKNKAWMIATKLFFEINNEDSKARSIFRGDSVSVNDLINEIKEEGHIKKSDISIYNKHISKSIGHLKVKSLTYLDLKNYILFCNIKTKSTFDNHKAAINKILDLAIQKQIISDKKHLELNQKNFNHNFEKKDRDDITAEEYENIILNFGSWIDNARTKRAKQGRLFLLCYIRILLFTGIRPGKELSEVEMKHISFSGNKITLKIASGKISKLHKRELPLSKDAVKALTYAIQEKTIIKSETTDYYDNIEIYAQRFPNEKLFYIDDFLPDYSKFFSNYIAELKEKGLIKEDRNITLYSFRHTYITNELKLKRDIYAVAKYCGTSVKMIEDHYARNRNKIDSEEYENQSFNVEYSL